VTLALGCLLAAAPGAESCTCSLESPTSFREHARDPLATVLVVRVLEHRITKFGDHSVAMSMRAEVEETVTGLEIRPRITIWGGSTADCMAWLLSHPVGSRWAFVLYHPLVADIQMMSPYWDEASLVDYYLPLCGQPTMPIQGPKDGHAAELRAVAAEYRERLKHFR
jgi:hypothetical protein